ncbi:MAG: DUF4115 domain-containing protein [Gracilibacteraceae bacterium]|jgi:transcriptional regulator with XRE-family HTH domain|nr:DUF4115 domain-containing protein [Gracilibacteraceae bacterium]
MTGVGEMLREAREDLGLSYQDVEQGIKIRPYYLQALEEEKFDRLPGTAYVKGFLRAYAKYLHLSDDKVMALYLASTAALPEEKIAPPPRPKQPPVSVFRRPALLFTAALAVVVVLALSFYFNQTGLRTPPDAPPTDIGENEPGFGQDQPETLPPDEPEVEEPPIIEGLIIEVAYSAPCWLDVRADGEPVFSGTKGEGESLRIEANEYVEFVSIGASEAIVITKNGEELPPFTEHVVRNFRVPADTPRIVPEEEGEEDADADADADADE